MTMADSTLKPVLTLTLPVPDARLSINSKCHPLQKSGITRKHRQLAFFATLEALGCPTVPQRLRHSDKQRLGLTGPMTSANYQKLARLLWPHPRPRVSTYSIRAIYQKDRNRDDDNLESLCKAYRDGIADALLIDDSTLRLEYKMMGVNPARPRFEIRLYPLCQTTLPLER